MDILPTALEAAKGELPGNLDGKSLLPLFNKPMPPKYTNIYLVQEFMQVPGAFSIEKTTKDHITERPFAPPAWVLIEQDYLLRFTGTLPPGIYHEHMQGRPQFWSCSI